MNSNKAYAYLHPECFLYSRYLLYDLINSFQKYCQETAESKNFVEKNVS